ncbi:MAG: hydroxymethylbilane synthase [Bacteroidales bacterium]|nr:hydroxymethylbilane synthase [Bacteroidales bacterium]MBN2756221.1 hydroxymethylbilane synthase [Bacteroidales bacterium]
MQNTTIKIGTRGSQLALYQAERLKSELLEKFPEKNFEIKIIKTKGDKILDVALSKIGDKGLFTKEIENELIAGSVDIAVHSLKDLPTVLPKGLKLGAVLERGEFRDALISLNGKKITDLNENDIIATSSLRRKAQLLKINPNFNIIDIRGNVNTRIDKMKNGYCTAMIMAAAGLQRLNMDEYISEVVDHKIITPAVSQGIIAIETRENDDFIDSIVEKINHPESYLAALAERKFLNILEGGCQIPVGCYTEFTNDDFSITGFISMPDNTNLIEGSLSGKKENAVEIAEKLAKSFHSKGALQIVEFVRKFGED